MHGNKEEKSFNLKAFFSPKGVFTERNIIVMGMLIAVSVVVNLLTTTYIPSEVGSGGWKPTSFSYLPGVITATLFGPTASLAYGFVCDAVKFITKPTGAYHPGYALSEMVTYFIYACFFFNQKIKLWKVALSRVFVIVFVYLGLNFLWQFLSLYLAAGDPSAFSTMATAATYFTSFRLLNHLIQFVPHVALTYGLCKYAGRFKAAAKI